MWDLWNERFISYLKKLNVAERTVREYPYQLRFFFQFLSDNGIDLISQVTKGVIQEYQTYLYYYEKKGRKFSFATQHCKLSVVKTFFRFLVREDYLPYDPSAAIELPRRKKLLPRGILTVSEVMKVLDAPRGNTPLLLRDKAILELLYATGMRNAELRGLTILDTDLLRRQLRICHGKGKKERCVPLGECASRHLERYLKQGRPRMVTDASCILVFVSTRGRKITSAILSWIVKKYAKKAGIGKVVTPHCFRHSCATHMLRNKADLRSIQELLGHSSVQTTQIYTKVELSSLKEVHTRCHPREKKGSLR
jgi:integrase/recombinase XerD